jgi:hypothetical protein
MVVACMLDHHRLYSCTPCYVVLLRITYLGLVQQCGPTAPSAYALLVLLLVPVQLKWNIPDETGGEAIQRYELLVTPQPAGWEGPPADQQVRMSSSSRFKLGVDQAAA